MNRTLVSGVVATVAASAVLACSLISLPPPIAPIQIGLDDILEHGTGAAIMVVGETLQNMYGDNFNSSEVHVNSVPIRFFSASYLISFTKECDKNFIESARAKVAALGATGPSGGGFAYTGPSYFDAGSFRPIYGTSRVCAGDGSCVTQQWLLGWEYIPPAVRPRQSNQVT